jgi:hypothetical protein
LHDFACEGCHKSANRCDFLLDGDVQLHPEVSAGEITNMTALQPPANSLLRPELPEVTDSTVQQGCLVDRTVDLLLASVSSRELWLELFIRAQGVLETRIVAVDNSRIARQHLQNALRYAFCDEFGAAAFELRMLRSLCWA